jgi:hypothetical protein
MPENKILFGAQNFPVAIENIETAEENNVNFGIPPARQIEIANRLHAIADAVLNKRAVFQKFSALENLGLEDFPEEKIEITFCIYKPEEA